MGYVEELISDLKSEVVADLKAKIADIDTQKADMKEELISILLGREWHDMNANPNDVPEIKCEGNCELRGECKGNARYKRVIARIADDFEILFFYKANTIISYYESRIYGESHLKHDCFLKYEVEWSTYHDTYIEEYFPFKIDKWISLDEMCEEATSEEEWEAIKVAKS